MNCDGELFMNFSSWTNNASILWTFHELFMNIHERSWTVHKVMNYISPGDPLDKLKLCHFTNPLSVLDHGELDHRGRVRERGVGEEGERGRGEEDHGLSDHTEGEGGGGGGEGERLTYKSWCHWIRNCWWGVLKYFNKWGYLRTVNYCSCLYCRQNYPFYWIFVLLIVLVRFEDVYVLVKRMEYLRLIFFWV